MKPKCLKSSKKMKSLLYYSGLLNKEEIASFRIVYSFLCENKNREKRRLTRVADHYKAVDLATRKDRTIARYYYGVLKLRRIFVDYQRDLISVRGMTAK